MITVQLTLQERIEALNVARQRQNVNRGSGRGDAKVLKNGLEVDVQGAIGEIAIAKHFNLVWDGKIKSNEEWLEWRKSGHDVSGLEVRFTKHRKGNLILQKKDKDDGMFVLITQIEPGRYEIVGWCFGLEGKQSHYWKDVGYGRPCFYVPREKLRKLEELKQFISAQ